MQLCAILIQCSAPATFCKRTKLSESHDRSRAILCTVFVSTSSLRQLTLSCWKAVSNCAMAKAKRQSRSFKYLYLSIVVLALALWVGASISSSQRIESIRWLLPESLLEDKNLSPYLDHLQIIIDTTYEAINATKGAILVWSKVFLLNFILSLMLGWLFNCGTFDESSRYYRNYGGLLAEFPVPFCFMD